MNVHLPFDFLVNKENNTLTVRREFAATRQLVWDCYTKSELLERWFAPKPFVAKTKSMDFSEGGHWVYAMVGPDGTEHWGRTDYQTIQAIDYYTALDVFCDADGNINTDLPTGTWTVTFSDLGENAMVETVVFYNSLADLETIVNMGMKEGLTACLDQLDELLSSKN